MSEHGHPVRWPPGERLGDYVLRTRVVELTAGEPVLGEHAEFAHQRVDYKPFAEILSPRRRRSNR